MKRLLIILLVVSSVLLSCNNNGTSGSIEKWKAEIIEAEKAFAAMAKEKSIPEAFIHYAADEAVIMRNNSVLEGKDKIIEHFSGDRPSTDRISLEWAPDFVDVSASGDLGYTYGKYVYTKTDSSGQTITQEGIFHTVWKRQDDGTWKYVWD